MAGNRRERLVRLTLWHMQGRPGEQLADAPLPEAFAAAAAASLQRGVKEDHGGLRELEHESHEPERSSSTQETASKWVVQQARVSVAAARRTVLQDQEQGGRSRQAQ